MPPDPRGSVEEGEGASSCLLVRGREMSFRASFRKSFRRAEGALAGLKDLAPSKFKVLEFLVQNATQRVYKVRPQVRLHSTLRGRLLALLACGF